MPTVPGASGTLAQFPTAIQNIVQQGFLEREMEEGLDSVLAYDREALVETIPARIGESLTRTRKGRMSPTTTPLVPAAINSGMDNGLSPVTYADEQYTYQVLQYGQTSDVNIMQEQAGAADQLIANARNLGVAAAQSLERIAKQALFAAYLGGNSRVRGDYGTNNTTHCQVDDIRGFLLVLVNGTPTAISGANPLTVNEIAAVAGGQNQVLSVTGVAADAVNVSSVPDGISGIITFATATQPVSGDALVSSGAPIILRPGGAISTNQLKGGANLSLSLLEDGVATLRDNAIPTMADGTYHVILDNRSERQLLADQDFKIYYAGREQSPEIRTAYLIRLLGLTFIPTTEAYVQKPFSGADAANNIAVTVRRPIMIGAECLLRGNYEGLETWINREGLNPIGAINLIEGVAQILRPMLDRLQQILSLSWYWAGAYATPTDVTATPDIIPTASSALYKRAVVLEHAS